MTLIVQYRIQKDGQRIGRKRSEYRLDGKVISAAEAKTLRDNPDVEFIDLRQAEVVQRTVSDALTAIQEVEMYLPEFVIDSTVKIEGGVFANNKNGDELKLYDDHLEVFVKRDGTVTASMVYTFDIAESRFISEVQKVGDAETFEITGDSGTIYTFSKDYTLLVRTVESPVTTGETLSHYVCRQRNLSKKARAA